MYPTKHSLIDKGMKKQTDLTILCRMRQNFSLRRWFLVLIVIMASTQLYAGFFDSLSIGIGGGYDSYNTSRVELYLKSDLKVFNRKAEIKAGLNNRSYQLEFDDVKDLDAQSIGFFGDFAVYPFNTGLFTGLRWESINFNWLTPESMSKVRRERNYSATSLYTGNCVFFPIGYNFQLSDKIALKLYAQPGFQQFDISNGSYSSGSYVFVNGSSSGNMVYESHYEFIYNINISLEFKIK